MASSAKFSVKKCLSALREWVFSLATGPEESKKGLAKHWQKWKKKHNPDLINTLSIEKPVTNKKVNRLPPLLAKEFCSAHSS